MIRTVPYRTVVCPDAYRDEGTGIPSPTNTYYSSLHQQIYSVTTVHPLTSGSVATKHRTPQPPNSLTIKITISNAGGKGSQKWPLYPPQPQLMEYAVL